MPFSSKILIIEDSETDALHMRSSFAQVGFTEVQWVNAFDAFYEAISKETWDIIVCDYYLGDITALDIVKNLHDLGLFTPVIVASGQVTEKMKADILGRGAKACISKSNMPMLLQTVQAEAKRIREEEVLKAKLLNCVHNAVIATTKEEKVIIWNSHAERLYGWSEVEMRGLNPYTVLWPKGTQPLADQVRACLARDGHWEGEVTAVKKSGETLPVYLHLSRLFDGQMKEVGIVGVSFDLTDKKTLEEQLLQSQKLDSIGKLAGGIAHDFNNLLTVINGYSSLLLVDNLAKNDLHEAASQILVAAESAARLTNQLLIFSRKHAFQMESVNINSILADTTKMLRRLIPENISLHINASDDLPFIHGDVGMLYQVILNLVVNARDAMAGGGRIDIVTFETLMSDPSCGPGKAEQPVVALGVYDTGEGISQENLKRIFDPFFTTKQVGKGTGLGLSTVYGIVKKHGGWITVKSDLGAGAQFTVFFPVSKNVNVVEPYAEKKRTLHSPSNARILVVEDQTEVGNLIKRLLVKHGYQVTLCNTSSEALEVIERGFEFDLVLTDIIMPGNLTGSELARRIRSRHEVRIIFMTGYSSEMTGSTRFIGEGETLLRKPFTNDALLTAIQNSLHET